MQLLTGLAGILFFSLAYFGYFPALTILVKKKRPGFAWIFLLCTLLLCSGLFREAVSGNVFISMFLVTFIGSGVFYTVSLLRGHSLVRAALIAHLPVVIYGLYLMLVPGIFSEIEALAIGFLTRLELPQDAPVKGLERKYLDVIAHVISRLFVSLSMLDLSFRLLIGFAVLARIQRLKKVFLQAPNFSTMRYPNWPIWVVAASLGGLFLSLYFPSRFGGLIWASLSVLVVVSPFFLTRGISVVSWRIKKLNIYNSWPIYLKLFLLLLTFWIWPYILIAVILMGVLDIWLDFRKIGKPLDEKR